MVEPVVATANFDDDYGHIILDPNADLVGHDVDLYYLFDFYDVLLCLLLSP